MYRLLSIYVGLVLTASGLISAHSVCTPPPSLKTRLQAKPEADAYAELGVWFGDHGKYDCAVEAYRSGLKLEPDSARLSYLLGLSLLQAGDAKQALAPLQQSIRLMPGVLKPHLILANAFEQLQEHGNARAEWGAALQIDPHSTIALDGLSKNLLGQGDYVTVIHLLGPSSNEESLAVDLAQAYSQADMSEHAIEILRKGLESKPGSSELSSALVTLLVLQAHYEDAAKIAKSLVQARPSDLAAKKLYLHVLVLNDDVTLARPLGRKLLILAPHDFEVLYLNGVLERSSGEYEAARVHLQQAVAIDPNYYNCRYNLGVVLEQLKDSKGALAQFQKALALGATEPEIRFEYAKVLRTLGETKLAEEQLKIYQDERKAKADRTLAASKMAQADKELANGDAQKATALYREAATAVPQNAMVQYKLAMALDKSGDAPSEVTALERAIKLDPHMAIAHHQLGYLASRSGDSIKAEEQFRAAVGDAPGYVEAWISLAATLGMESRFPEAQKAVESALQLDPKNTEAIELQKELSVAAGQMQR